MKKLTLVRHAKSSWSHAGLPDHDRPLNRRGKEDAPLMGQRLAGRGVRIDRVISSTAVRALTTAKAIADEIDYPWEGIVREERLYHAGLEDILEVVEETPEHIDHLMLFGHNPGFTEAVNYFSPSPVDNVPTCGVVEIHFDVEEWAQVGDTVPLAVFFDAPKQRGLQVLWGER